MYDSCQQVKTTKIYNQKCQNKFQHLYYFIHANLLRQIIPKKYLGEQYFFIFSNKNTYHIET